MATNNPTDQDIPGDDIPEESASLRDEIDAAFEQHATDETPEEETRITERSRDGKGRFASKAQGDDGAQQLDPEAKPTDPAQQAQQPQPQAGTPAPAPGTFKAPAAWKPAQREKWASVPQDVQSEITRREGEYQRTLEEAAEARKFVQAFEQVTRPYEMFIRAENSNPLAAVQNLMQTAANLRVGTPQHKAQMVAEICRTYAVDIGILDGVLTAQQNGVPWAQYQAAQAPNPQQFRDPRLDQFLANQERERQQREQQDAQQLRGTLDAFANSHEFYSDVADTMALLVEHATARGLPIDLEKFYSQACQMDPDINKILSARGGNTNSRGGNGNTSPQSQAVLRAKRAAVSVRGDSTPTGSAVPKNDSIRAAIEAAFTAGDE